LVSLDGKRNILGASTTKDELSSPNSKQLNAILTSVPVGIKISILHGSSSERWVNDYKNFSILEILLYNLRHIQHHAAQLNLILRQTIHNAPKWVNQAHH
jgi:hypothetical protein